MWTSLTLAVCTSNIILTYSETRNTRRPKYTQPRQLVAQILTIMSPFLTLFTIFPSLKKIAGSGSRFRSAPESNDLLLVQQPNPQKKFHKVPSTTFWDVNKFSGSASWWIVMHHLVVCFCLIATPLRYRQGQSRDGRSDNAAINALFRIKSNEQKH